MNEELDYAEMLEIPVETVTVHRKERKKHREPDLQERLVEQVNDRMEESAEENEEDPAYAESRTIAREDKPVSRKKKLVRWLLIGEIAAVCALCATIFLTNVFMSNSAINTFVRGLFRGSETQQTTADPRVYSDFKLTPVVNDTVDAEIAVSSTGVLSFTANCSVYPPCDGKVSSVTGDETSGYSVEIKHSDTFSTIISGLDTVYAAEGDAVKGNLPVGYSGGEKEVRVMMYSQGALLNCFTVNDNTLAWS